MAASLRRPPSFTVSQIRPSLNCRRSSRCFSSTPVPLGVGPESPHFIEIPQPPQQEYITRRRIKGVLPVPRNIFHRRTADKSSAEFIAAVTPEPRQAGPKPAINPDSAEYVSWKERMAVSRRTNLREGVATLHKRKTGEDRRLAIRSQRRQAERDTLVNAPQREDERLTSPTIPESLRNLPRGPLPDPDREARLARARDHLRLKREAFEEMKMEKLHALYMQARDFITTEAQLNDAIDRTFVSQPPEFSGDISEAESIWSTGPPETVQNMINKVIKIDRRDTTEGGGKL